MKRKIFSVLILCLCFNGCLITEPFKKFIGTSTQALENAKPKGISKIYGYKKEVCFRKTLAALKNMGVYLNVVNEQKSLIAAMNFKMLENAKAINQRDIKDTTELGIFFDEEPNNKTKITITSLSKPWLEKYSKEIFENLDSELKKEATD